MHNPKYLAEIIVTKVIDKSKTDEQNIETLTQYIKCRQYEDISQAIASIRIACKAKEDEILNELEKHKDA